MFVQGDRVHLSQVLINLIINAMDAIDDLEGARRRIVLRARTNNEGWIEIGVADAGPGVPPEAMKRMFAPFFTTKSSGIGMGLSISRTIIEAHKGSGQRTMPRLEQPSGFRFPRSENKSDPTFRSVKHVRASARSS